MIDYEEYPADFNAEQERALDALAEMFNADTIADIPAWYLAQVRKNNFTLCADVYTLEDLGYEFADETGLDDCLYHFFDFEGYGAMIDSSRNGNFTNAGWITFD